MQEQGLSKLLSSLRRERQNSNLTVFKFACESKVNVKVNVNQISKVILPIQKMLYASLGCYIYLGLMFLPRVYLAGYSLLQFQQSP